MSCLNEGGCAVGVLADDLARCAVSAGARTAIVDGSLVLISPFEPETRFFIYNAMARNKLIYTLADYALVINAEYEKGGTWAGAKENLDKGWTPLFVRTADNVPAGNMHLLELGAVAIDETSLSDAGIEHWMRQQAASCGTSRLDCPSQGSLPLF